LTGRKEKEAEGKREGVSEVNRKCSKYLASRKKKMGGSKESMGE